MFWTKKDKTQKDAAPITEEPADKNWLSRLSDGLSASSQKLTGGLVDFITKVPLDQAMLDQLEEALIAADLGPVVATQLVDEFAFNRFGSNVSAEDIRAALAPSIAKILEPVAKTLDTATAKPFVMLMVGVNGSGKTTTIGKLATQFAAQGKKVVVAAGDTFRAAAVEQLTIWSQRSGATIVEKGLNADPAAVAFAALEQAEKDNADIVMIDTAGRLQNQQNLMEELAKIKRVIQKKNPDAPHATILTLDATIGQNALNQVEIFNKIVPLSGLVVTKLDGSARAGVVVSLAKQFNIPIIAIGVGEKAQDLQAFDPMEFARALVR
ncbi:MAG TPA: signal recognition particle-docking protein FtsY [Alphaproteobacteria bacterium]